MASFASPRSRIRWREPAVGYGVAMSGAERFLRHEPRSAFLSASLGRRRCPDRIRMAASIREGAGERGEVGFRRRMLRHPHLSPGAMGATVLEDASSRPMKVTCRTDAPSSLQPLASCASPAERRRWCPCFPDHATFSSTPRTVASPSRHGEAERQGEARLNRAGVASPATTSSRQRGGCDEVGRFHHLSVALLPVRARLETRVWSHASRTAAAAPRSGESFTVMILVICPVRPTGSAFSELTRERSRRGARKIIAPRRPRSSPRSGREPDAVAPNTPSAVKA